MMRLDFPVLFSDAETLRMAVASMSKTTSVCGTPRGAGGMPRRPNLPRKFVAARHLALTLVYLDELFVRVSREDLRLLTRGSCVVTIPE